LRWCNSCKCRDSRSAFPRRKLPRCRSRWTRRAGDRRRRRAPCSASSPAASPQAEGGSVVCDQTRQRELKEQKTKNYFSNFNLLASKWSKQIRIESKNLKRYTFYLIPLQCKLHLNLIKKYLKLNHTFYCPRSWSR